MKFLYSISVAILAALTFNTGYAEQMCNDSVEVTTPSSRFEINDDQAFDTKTGLVWKRCLEGQNWNTELSQCDGNAISVNWKGALQSVSEGWRLPNIKELGSIVEHSCGNPSINLNVFPIEAISPTLWSSTPNRLYLGQVDNRRAWATLFQDGVSRNVFKSDSRLSVLLVKDAVILEPIEELPQ
ncbi:DUF1566 domain-containing protein [Leucothrix arctica]|uniref:Fimbrial protein FimH n=1 Tax=Leucothrix arctica TaxID=1481894 RepID=A0A317CG28_9GAMM|nr:DUF1566 domain-containing protein [Leucothrix arctica]PWQ97486.1 fimbrial protein FimH [Leucothrix arctica]